MKMTEAAGATVAAVAQLYKVASGGVRRSEVRCFFLGLEGFLRGFGWCLKWFKGGLGWFEIVFGACFKGLLVGFHGGFSGGLIKTCVCYRRRFSVATMRYIMLWSLAQRKTPPKNI